MIRPATEEDIPQIVRMASSFVDETSYKLIIELDPKRVAASVLKLIENPDGMVFVSGTDGNVSGMIAMLAYDHPFSGERTAFEVVWWVDPEVRGDGIRLLKAAEEWAKQIGAKKVQMVAPNKRVEGIYERLGYSAVEVSYQRSL